MRSFLLLLGITFNVTVLCLDRTKVGSRVLYFKLTRFIVNHVFLKCQFYIDFMSRYSLNFVVMIGRKVLSML